MKSFTHIQRPRFCTLEHIVKLSNAGRDAVARRQPFSAAVASFPIESHALAAVLDRDRRTRRHLGECPDVANCLGTIFGMVTRIVEEEQRGQFLTLHVIGARSRTDPCSLRGGEVLSTRVLGRNALGNQTRGGSCDTFVGRFSARTTS